MSWTESKLPNSHALISPPCDDLASWLALLRAPGIGSKTFTKLLETHTPGELLNETLGALTGLGLKPETIEALKNPDLNAIANDLAWLDQPNHYIVRLTDSSYPERLKQIPDPPPLLFVNGEVSMLSRPQIAIVGSRNPSKPGWETAFNFAGALTGIGFVVSSGLAMGIDAASHEGALAAEGLTVAVVGTGPDRIYPASNKNLAARIAERGVIVTELPTGSVAKAHHFPRRNRIISGLCQGLLVVEAAKDSGSLITARLALEYNREVFAIPGSIHNPLARGCNGLIREGAKLVETVDDILEEFRFFNQKVMFPEANPIQSMLDLEQQTILNLIPYDPTSIDDLVEKSGKSIETVAATLLILELNGLVATSPGGCYMRIT